jgi:hypothetical protein
MTAGGDPGMEHTAVIPVVRMDDAAAPADDPMPPMDNSQSPASDSPSPTDGSLPAAYGSLPVAPAPPPLIVDLPPIADPSPLAQASPLTAQVSLAPAQATTQHWAQTVTAIPAASVAPDPVGPAPAIRPAVLPEGHPVRINCPECGASGLVDPTRRDAHDFCQACDFPLFWSKDQISLGALSDAGDDSLYRLPGTLGRAVVASVACPHCNEPNLPTAVYCVRCGRAMQFIPPPPPPPPPAQAPVPMPAAARPEPEPDRLWIWWVLLIAMFVLTGVGLVLAQHWY